MQLVLELQIIRVDLPEQVVPFPVKPSLHLQV